MKTNPNTDKRLERFFLEERENEKKNVELEQNIMICTTVRSRNKRFRLIKRKRLAIFQEN